MTNNNSSNKSLLADFHWLMDVVHNMDVGLIILDMNFHIKLWNGFMQNHSAKASSDVLNQSIFTVFPELPQAWFQRKLNSVAVLRNAGFTTWEQRPYLFRFKNYRPVTGVAEHMYQNCTILPLINTQDQVEQLCLIIYDVTETAINRIQLQHANAQLQHISRTDGLTGLLNRKTWEASLNHEFKRFQRYRIPCSLIMFDIDHFKKVNDGYGHPAGDEVIRQTAAAIKQSIRESDLAGRYGGEEFAIILVGTDMNGAKIMTERLRKRIEALVVTFEQHAIQFTISLGIAEVDLATQTLQEWIGHADQCLYAAKHNGRNQWVAYTP